MHLERAVIEINGGCNYTCAMCPQSNPGRSRNFLRKMPLTQFDELVEECVAHGASVINLDGSGEATLNRDLPKYIEVVKKHGAKAYIFSNGKNMRGNLMKESVDAGLDFFRFSIIGYDSDTYRRWMGGLSFQDVLKNLYDMEDYISKSRSNCTLATYHLILDNSHTSREKELYLSITAGHNIKTEIWMMHNWSGVYKPEYDRQGTKRTCGRPFSPEIVIRAGGLNGSTGAVHPCCQVLGRDDEAVLGHTSLNSIEDIWFGEDYNRLRKAHELGEFPDFCTNCDFLIDDAEVLIYSNHGTHANSIHGTSIDLKKHRGIL